MQLGSLLPLGDIGGDPAVVREYAQSVDASSWLSRQLTGWARWKDRSAASLIPMLGA